jgi:hypothetical protein
MALIDHWEGKLFMLPQNLDLSDGGHDDARKYAENQINWGRKVN